MEQYSPFSDCQDAFQLHKYCNGANLTKLLRLNWKEIPSRNRSISL